MKQLKDIMKHDVEVVRPEADLREIARLMKQRNVGALPVCDGQKIQGIVTDRDIVLRGLAEKRDPAYTQARDVMSKEVHWCYEDDSVEDAARLMHDKKIRRLIVVDHEKNLCGILSTQDLPNPSVSSSAASSAASSAVGNPASASFTKRIRQLKPVSRIRAVPGRTWGSVFLGAAALGLSFWAYRRRAARVSARLTEEEHFGRSQAA
jgi:CBS domain-containing protein